MADKKELKELKDCTEAELFEIHGRTVFDLEVLTNNKQAIMREIQLRQQASIKNKGE